MAVKKTTTTARKNSFMKEAEPVVENTKPVVTMADSLNNSSNPSSTPDLEVVLKAMSSPKVMNAIRSDPKIMKILQDEINKNKKS